MPCSVCKQPGHNKLTCQKKYSTAVVGSTKEHHSIAIAKIKNSTDNNNNNVCSRNINDTNESFDSQIVLKNNCKKLGKNDEASETKSATDYTKRVDANYDENENIIKMKENSVNSKVASTTSAAKDKEQVSLHKRIAGPIVLKDNSKPRSKNSDTDIDCNQRISASYVARNKNVTKDAINPKDASETIKNSGNKEPHHRKISAVNDKQRVNHTESLNKKTFQSWKDIEISDGDKEILCKQGMIRFFEGPTDDEGEGYIYMYTYSDTDERKSIMDSTTDSTFKIGMTKHLPERRIHVLGNANKEKYILVHSHKIAWRRLAEQLIHKQLTVNGYHSPREGVKGGTEWFKGKKDEIINVMKLVIRFLNVYGLALEQ